MYEETWTSKGQGKKSLGVGIAQRKRSRFTPPLVCNYFDFALDK